MRRYNNFAKTLFTKMYYYSSGGKKIQDELSTICLKNDGKYYILNIDYVVDLRVVLTTAGNVSGWHDETTRRVSAALPANTWIMYRLCWLHSAVLKLPTVPSSRSPISTTPWHSIISRSYFRNAKHHWVTDHCSIWRTCDVYIYRSSGDS